MNHTNELQQLAEQWKDRADDCGRLARAALAARPVAQAQNWASDFIQQWNSAYPRMDIYAKPGTLVVFDSMGGYEGQRKDALKVLELRHLYEVERIEVGSCSSSVRLKGVSGVFNTVLFAAAPTPEAGEPGGLPERDHTKPAEQQGLFRKFDVRRTDGSDGPGGKHAGCEYFVLDVVHDKHAPAALAAYAEAVEATHPDLASDMRERYKLATHPPAASEQAGAPKANMFHDAGAIAQCQYCKRYTLDRKALGDRQPVCSCGKQHGWSGSFKPPGPGAQWHGPAPAATPSPASPAGELSDEELTDIYKRANGEDIGKAQPLTTPRIFNAMRAAHALATQPLAEQKPVAFVHWPISGPPRLVWHSTAALNDAIAKTHEGYQPDLLLYPAAQPEQVAQDREDAK